MLEPKILTGNENYNKDGETGCNEETSINFMHGTFTYMDSIQSKRKKMIMQT